MATKLSVCCLLILFNFMSFMFSSNTEETTTKNPFHGINYLNSSKILKPKKYIKTEYELYKVENEQLFHTFYNTAVTIDKAYTEDHWKRSRNFSISRGLSGTHDVYTMLHRLPFVFPYYGRQIQKLFVGKAGFLYLGDDEDFAEGVIQQVAPLRSGYGFASTKYSTLRYLDTPTEFVVVWENLKLSKIEDDRLYRFSVSLHMNGDIEFIYYSIPNPLIVGDVKKYPFTISISDGYKKETKSFYSPYIVNEYHHITFNTESVEDGTVIRFTALPTCVNYKDCESCVTANLWNQKCIWCHSANVCSTGKDHWTGEWITKNCDANSTDSVTGCSSNSEPTHKSTPKTDI